MVDQALPIGAYIEIEFDNAKAPAAMSVKLFTPAPELRRALQTPR